MIMSETEFTKINEETQDLLRHALTGLIEHIQAIIDVLEEVPILVESKRRTIE